ncbi:MAG TPA: hypothetical protein VGN63_05335 [Flavisolibacter sp.]|jgi:hypothetical protein|nr:hypothetical protein [Flavisolibacter sp.]
MFNKIYLLLGIGLLILASSCGHVDAETVKDKPKKGEERIGVPTEKKKHLNINVLLDLSDRINPNINPKFPGQKERDIAVVKTLCQAFKNNVDAFNAFKAEAKMNVFFHPEPNNAEVADIANKLNVACQAGTSASAAKRNKQIYQTLDGNFSSGLNQIYDLAIQSENYPGSNIFRFMKDEVKRCVESPSVYRNVLVILTDGYVYYENEKYQEANRYSYIERNFDHFKRFRDRKLLQSDFEKKDYGLIKVNDNLKDLEVLVLELSPPTNSPVDYDILKKYWAKWLTEMGVKKFDVLKTEQPVYTQKKISEFLATGL